MSVLQVDSSKLEALRAFAESHPIGLEEMIRIGAGSAPGPFHRPGHQITLPAWYSITYAIECLPLRVGAGHIWMRHMSIATARPGHFPAAGAVRIVSEALGFPALEDCRVVPFEGANSIDVLAEWPGSAGFRRAGRPIGDPGTRG